MRRESGMSLITAIFLLVILAALGAAIYSLGAAQQTQLALDLQGSRAYHAARSGLEFGAFQATQPIPSCPVSTSFAMDPSFGDFTTVTVLCSATPHTEGNTARTLYLITARACNQPTPAGVCPNPAPGHNYVERELQLSVINPP
jgi:MSHA biogenesis protein MshP